MRASPVERYGIRLTLFALAVLLVGIPFGFLLEQVERNGPMVRVDTYAANHLHDVVRRSHAAVDALQVISALGKPPTLVLLCSAVAVWLLWRRRWLLAVYLVSTTVVGGWIDTIVKHVVSRDRPSLTHPVATAFGKSFPSGHAMSSTIAYGALLLVFLPLFRRRRLAIGVVVTLVLAIGFSRLALGVHYISDVLGGFALGGAWLALSTAAFEIWRDERRLVL